MSALGMSRTISKVCVGATVVSALYCGSQNVFGGGGGAVESSPWRFASPLNQAPNINWPLSSFSGGALTNFAARNYRPIGSGDCVALKCLLRNWAVELGSAPGSGGVIQIYDVFLESVELAVSVRMTFSGANGISLASGAYDVTSDPVYPAAFGLDKFSRGGEYYLRVYGNFNGDKLPGCRTRQSLKSVSTAGNVGTWECTNISGVGGLAGTGKTFSAGGGFPVDLLGIYSEDPIVVGGFGDSVWMGTGDNYIGTDALPGVGYLTRALVGGNVFTDGISGCNYAITGGYMQLLNGNHAALMSEIKYASIWLDEYGTNNFDTGDNYTPSQLNTALSYATNSWTYLRAANYPSFGRERRIAQMLLMPRTNPPTGVTPTDQTVAGPKWDVGGNADAFNAHVLSAVGAGLDAAFDPGPIVRYAPGDPGTLNYHLWKNGSASCADGTHQLQATAISVATGPGGLRSFIETLAATQ